MAVAPDNLSSFGELLNAFRKRRHLTQQQLATDLGMHRHSISRWEQGDVLPAHKAIVLELARQLHLDSSETRRLMEASLTALAPYWLVPLRRNLYFTGREAILEELHAHLGVDQTVALTQSSALHGLGGVGKTQIALEYAYRYALEYSAVFWIGAETDEQVISALLHIAEVLQLPERTDKDPQCVVAAVQRWLVSHNQWLLIWDNVEDLTLLNRFLPATRSGANLLTTRCQTLGTFARGLDLLPMEREEGILFLFRRAKVLPPEATHEHVDQFVERAPSHYSAALALVTLLGGLPLALDQAGAYLEATQCGLVAYLDLFRHRRAALLEQRGEVTRDHPVSVSTTFTLAIQVTTELHPAIRDLLCVCMLLHPDAIPEQFIRSSGTHLGAQLGHLGHDDLEWNQLIALACSYSLLSRHEETQTLSIHRLVQAVLLDTITTTERTQWVIRTIQALDSMLPTLQPTLAYATWNVAEQLLPHARSCLYQAEGCDESLAHASLAYKVAEYLRDSGRYTEAELLYLRALRIRQQKIHALHPLVAFAHSGLANLYKEQHRYAEAETRFHQALHILEHMEEPVPADIAQHLNYLAQLYVEQSNFDQAQQLYQRCQSIWEQTQGPDHPNVARILNNRALLAVEQGKYTQAEQFYHHSGRILVQTLGHDHPLLASHFHNFGVLRQLQGNYPEAEQFFRHMLRIRTQTQQPDHPDLAIGQTMLADLYIELGEYREAISLLHQALNHLEQVLGPDSTKTARVLNSLGKLSYLQGKYAEAEPLYLRALHIYEHHHQAEHRDVAEPLTNLANLYRDQDRGSEAGILYQKALSIREKHLTQEHPGVAEILYELACWHQKQGNLNEALFFAERALHIQVQTLGDTHPKTGTTYTLLRQVQKHRTSRICEQATENDGEHMCLPEQRSATHHQMSTSSDLEEISLQAFLTACCIRSPHAWCRVADLWEAYKHWAQEQEEVFPLSQRAFTRQIKEQGISAARTKSARIWRGVTIAHQKWKVT